MSFNWRKDLIIGYVNLDSRTDREQHMQSEFKRIGLDGYRFSGMLPSEYTGDPAKVKVMMDRTPGAVGCHFSQVSVMKSGLSSPNAKAVMVLEDDVVFCSDIKERLDHIEYFLEGKDWDVVFLGGTFHVNPYVWHTGKFPDMPTGVDLGRDVELTDDPRMVRTYGAFSTHAYIVNVNSIEKILKLFDENIHLSMGIDWLFIKLQPQLNCFAFVPGCVKQMDNQSNIGQGITRFSDFAKLGPYWWADRMEEFNPLAFNWAEADGKKLVLNGLEYMPMDELDKQQAIRRTTRHPIVNTPEETNGYQGLLGEVEINDSYRLKSINWVPDIVFDFGANIGTFTRFAQKLWPKAIIIAVEPNEDNITHFRKFTSNQASKRLRANDLIPGEVILMEAAIAQGSTVYRYKGAANGAHERYVNVTDGYDKEAMQQNTNVEKASVACVMPSDLINWLLQPGQYSVLKLDIEGNELAIWDHQPSMDALKKIDFLTIELHYFSQDSMRDPAIREKTLTALKQFEATHDCEIVDDCYFYGYKKPLAKGCKQFDVFGMAERQDDGENILKGIAPEIKFRKDLGQLLDYYKLPRHVVEIGCAEGLNAVVMLGWGLEKFYMVDNWAMIHGQHGDGGFDQAWHDKNYKEAMERVDAFRNKTDIRICKGLSRDMAMYISDNSVAMAYFDGDHSKQGMFNDLLNYFPKVMKGGIIAGHDYLSPDYGVKAAVEMFIANYKERPGPLDMHDGITYTMADVILIPENDQSDAGFYFIKK